MANITLKNVPRDLHGRLKASAAAHGHSLSSEVLFRLKSAVAATRVDREALLARRLDRD